MWELMDGVVLLLITPLAVVDVRRQRIPVSYLIILAAGSILKQCIGRQTDIWLILGGVGIGCIFLILSKVTEEGLGYGDSLGILILGIGLGTWKLLEVLMATFLLLFVWSMIIWFIRKKKNQRIPFYPFLVSGYFLVFLAGMV